MSALSIPAYWVLPDLPDIVSEWAALLPLASHLASFRHDYQVAGEIALSGRLVIDLFPKLGVHGSLSRLCSAGPEFLDEASVRGSSKTTVRDVNWGSVFPCANGAASKILAAYAIATAEHRVSPMPDGALQMSSLTEPRRTDLNSKGTASHASTVGHRRYQTLHVLDFSRIQLPMHWTDKLHRSLSCKPMGWIGFIFSFGILSILCLCGLYGTAAALLCGIAAQITRRFVVVNRPPGYLENNESHSACMLVSTHNNANTWYLYIGDRGVVDTLLNKTMITIPQSRTNRVVAQAFQVFHVAQIVTMTFVAAQKGWDGVAMIILMLLSWASRLRFKESSFARMWLQKEGVSIRARSFEFTGRTSMFGAIQAFSGSNRTLWMDDIVAPHPRRQAWLAKLGIDDIPRNTSMNDQDFNSHDLKSIELTATLAETGAELMRKELGRRQSS